MGILKDAVSEGAVVVQGVAHMGPSGFDCIGYTMGDTITAGPEPIGENIIHVKDLGNMLVMQQGTFMPNSMDLLLEAHPELAADVEARHTDQALRSEERTKLNLPAERKLIVNISLPNRLTATFFKSILKSSIAVQIRTWCLSTTILCSGNELRPGFAMRRWIPGFTFWNMPP